MTWTQNKNFCSVKGTVKKTKRQDRVGKKYWQNTYLIKDQHSKYAKNS